MVLALWGHSEPNFAQSLPSVPTSTLSASQHEGGMSRNTVP